MGILNQEVSELTKGLHHIMHLLQARVPMHHCKASLPSYPYGIQMVSIPTTAATTDTSFNRSSTYHLHSDHTSREVYSHQSTSCTGHWSCSATAVTHRPQSFSPPANSCTDPSVNSGSQLFPCHSSESMTRHMWNSTSLLSVSPGFQLGSPGHASHAGHKNSDNRPLSLSPTTISHSQPTLCLQPPSDSDEHACLLSSSLTGVSTHSLLDMSASSYSHPRQPSETPVSLSQDRTYLNQDTSIFQISDSRPSVLPVSSSTSTQFPPAGLSLNSESLRSNTLESSLPLGGTSTAAHNSLWYLLKSRGSIENKESESESLQRSSIGL